MREDAAVGLQAQAGKQFLLPPQTT